MLTKLNSPYSGGCMHVTELAAQTGVTAATIRYYARIGILNPSRESSNGYRLFSKADRRRVQFVRQAQMLGLRIKDIKRILESADAGQYPCPDVRLLVERRLQGIRKDIATLQATEARICESQSAWSDLQTVQPADGEICPLIERLSF